MMTRARSLELVALMASTALVVAACSQSPKSSNAYHLKQFNPGAESTNTTISPAEQQVINDWVAAERYHYQILQQPPGPARNDLVAGEAPIEIWPDVKKY